ncbi:MAG TPA: class I SAM-dependent methyltransferase, partial [Kribbella sp.]|nr:class I SAM-dependent methyltransferase [Kribbella sp.]
HDEYDRPGSGLARRLEVVQAQVRTALDRAPAGAVRVISLCAGQGRDVLDVVAEHPRRADVRARLVELDARLSSYAEDRARELGLTDQVDVVAGDAALIDQYDGMVPADVVLVCGVFGNISDEDIEATIDACQQLCQTGATLIWTRHRDEPDLVPQICDWFETRGFEREWVSEPDAGFGVGVHRYVAQPQPLVQGRQLFSFVRGGV